MARSLTPRGPLARAGAWEWTRSPGPGEGPCGRGPPGLRAGGGDAPLLTRARVSLAAASYTNYKKTPPPVPPRTTSKPLISVTAQSSTESTQDAYQDSRAQRMAPWAQDGRGLYNSTDSLDSSKALNLALETAAAQRHAESQGEQALLASRAEEFSRGSRPSIGVQVAPARQLVHGGRPSGAGGAGRAPTHMASLQAQHTATRGCPGPQPRPPLPRGVAWATGHPGSVERGYFDA